ncbi:hypothetical protein EMIT0P44_20129 [Pseudomonas sp. IT-P44]
MARLYELELQAPNQDLELPEDLSQTPRTELRRVRKFLDPLWICVMCRLISSAIGRCFSVAVAIWVF